MTGAAAPTGVGHGKVILVGEHAAVYGHPALAGALACGVTLRASGVVAAEAADPRRSGGSDLELRIRGWDVHVRASDDHPVARALAAVAGAFACGAGTIEGHADVPPGAGLGSSAALAVALARALAGACGRALACAEIEDIAARAERCFHGNPSGIDVAIAARGGLGLYRRGVGLTSIAAAPIPLLIGLSGQPRSTADMVARVAAARAARPAEVDAELEALGAAAERAAALLATPDAAAIEELGAIFAVAHRRLAGLGVSTDVLDAMTRTAQEAGAVGAKLTGGGGGGAVIALAPGREDAVLAAWRAMGKDGFVTRVGVPTS